MSGYAETTAVTRYQLELSRRTTSVYRMSSTRLRLRAKKARVR